MNRRIPLPKSFSYSRDIFNLLSKYCEKKLFKFSNNIVILVTGSLAKNQFTPRSDLDIIVIIDNKSFNESLKQRIIHELKNFHLKHAIEFYAIQSINEWKKTIRISALFCSDLIFAKVVWGNARLFNSLRRYTKTNDLEIKNCYAYFIYNLFYRGEQIQKYKDSDDLKYQLGGLRDMQFLVWLCKRLGNSEIDDRPKIFFKSLVSLKFIKMAQFNLIIKYYYSILNYKWELEKNGKKRSFYKQNYYDFRRQIIPIVQSIKKKVLAHLAKNKKKAWYFYIIKAQKNNLSDTTRLKLSRSKDETLNFCAVWKTTNKQIIQYFLNKSKIYWTVRAALALNPYIDKNQLIILLNQKYTDEDDIIKFIKQNPHFIHE